MGKKTTNRIDLILDIIQETGIVTAGTRITRSITSNGVTKRTGTRTRDRIGDDLIEQLRILIKARKTARQTIESDRIQWERIKGIYKRRDPDKLKELQTRRKRWIEETEMQSEGIERNIQIIKGKIRDRIKEIRGLH